MSCDITSTPAAVLQPSCSRACNQAVQQLAPANFDREVTIAPDGEYVALGAARLSRGAEPTPQVLEAYRELKDRTERWG